MTKIGGTHTSSSQPAVSAFVFLCRPAPATIDRSIGFDRIDRLISGRGAAPFLLGASAERLEDALWYTRTHARKPPFLLSSLHRHCLTPSLPTHTTHRATATIGNLLFAAAAMVTQPRAAGAAAPARGGGRGMGGGAEGRNNNGQQQQPGQQGQQQKPLWLQQCRQQKVCGKRGGEGVVAYLAAIHPPLVLFIWLVDSLALLGCLPSLSLSCVSVVLCCALATPTPTHTPPSPFPLPNPPQKTHTQQPPSPNPTRIRHRRPLTPHTFTPPKKNNRNTPSPPSTRRATRATPAQPPAGCGRGRRRGGCHGWGGC